MSDLFSDASPPPPTPERVSPIEFEVTVPVPPEHAAAGFAEHIHLWWPVEDLNVWGAGSFFDLEDNALVETSVDEVEAVWAEVSRTEQSTRLEMVWRHHPDGGTPTDLTIEFLRGPGDGTTLSLVHDGWDTEARSKTERELYQIFWPLALTKFQRFMGGTP
ncbi:SRPBCC domain-containing protein [Arthrobacter sp. TB 23]|uniref:SRPBCC domain-containing protein n=1 Tax=Arthrobacter sp. TB 23 TaxID=494419 RepID=UPI00036D5868|nr:SRPBCC domain-containing protein [Arthrobacter sp. TB 23]